MLINSGSPAIHGLTALLQLFEVRPMGIGELYRSRDFGLSIEIFPPKTADGDVALYENLERLVRYKPGFVSCTYGAGGSTQSRTVEICHQIQTRFQVPATAHFTCVGASVPELVQWLHFARREGVRNIMALRGDPPQGQTAFVQKAGGLRYANELVKLIRETYADTGIGVAGYPEKHPEAPSWQVDLENLKRKVDAGADAVVTQLFFVNEHFYRFRDDCVQAGITIPIVPGIMPITDVARIKKIATMCQSDIPADLVERLEAAPDDKEAQFEIGVEFATAQCRDLVDHGVPGIHFYVLNKSQACERILQGLDLATV